MGLPASNRRVEEWILDSGRNYSQRYNYGKVVGTYIGNRKFSNIRRIAE